VGDGGRHRPDPYWVGVRLYWWAAENYNDLDGRLLLAGQPGGAGGLTVKQLVNVAYTHIQESLDEEQWGDFLNRLRTPPGEKVRPRSKVSPQLMEMMRPGRAPSAAGPARLTREGAA
jgi:hypothetical protein